MIALYSFQMLNSIIMYDMKKHNKENNIMANIHRYGSSLNIKFDNKNTTPFDEDIKKSNQKEHIICTMNNKYQITFQLLDSTNSQMLNSSNFSIKNEEGDFYKHFKLWENIDSLTKIDFLKRF
jgi:hypothetical protein